VSDPLPGRVAPMFATPGPVPEGSGWAYEFKWDGVRAITAVAGEQIRVQSRHDKPMLGIYPELADLRDLVDESVVLDGEVVAVDQKGRPDFGLLQTRMQPHHPTEVLLRSAPVVYYVFDVLHLHGEGLTRLPYAARRDALAGLGLEGRSVSGAAVVCRRAGRHYPGHRRPARPRGRRREKRRFPLRAGQAFTELDQDTAAPKH
jgi:bifunctional non-homologous end joining protein LigD